MELLKIEEWAKDIMNECNCYLPLNISEGDKEKSESPAGYNPNDNCINVRTAPLIREYNAILKEGIDMSFQRFVELIITHEVGHAKDPELTILSFEKKKILDSIKPTNDTKEIDDKIEELSKVIFKSEENAWRYVEKRIDKEISKSYFEFKHRCFQTYIGFLLKLRNAALKVA